MAGPLNKKAGINAQRGAVTNADVDNFRLARLGGVRLRTDEHHALTVQVYREAGAVYFNGVVTLPDMGTTVRNPERFVAEALPGMRILYEAGVGAFEIGYQPNTAFGGYGLTWRSPQAWGGWFSEVVARFRAAFAGRPLRLGLPVMAIYAPRTEPDPLAGNRPRQPVSDIDFLEANRDTINRDADFIACATHWNDTAHMRDIAGGLRFIRHYHERFPGKRLVVAEFSNARPDKLSLPPNDDAWQAVGEEYAEFYTLIAQYDWLEAAYAQVLRDAQRPHESWVAPDGQRRRIFAAVQARSHVPEPHELRLTWPTESDVVTQAYGLRQLDYSGYSEGRLRGGHEGIDLRAPFGSVLRACLAGRVVYAGRTDGRFNGYGAYGEIVLTESIVTGVGRVQLIYAHLLRQLVDTGDTVQAGQPIGVADTTGNAQGAHLHLSLRISTVSLPAQLDYLNPGPYLDAPPVVAESPPRGAPRMQYARTYVLLPPPATLEWVEAVIRATWDEHRYTVGGSADDAGVGDLTQRRVIAINPSGWAGDLAAWLSHYYAGTDLQLLNAPNAATLTGILRSQRLPGIQGYVGSATRGTPREDYARTYILIPPRHDAEWALAAARATWTRFRTTIGGSSDDAGIGDLSFRRVIAVNPSAWGGDTDLRNWFNLHYAGVQYTALDAPSPAALQAALAQMSL